MTTDRWFEPNDVLLLTGAGFTKTFGGFLASEMWAEILSQPEVARITELRNRLLEQLNYEMLLHIVRSSSSTDYNDNDRATLETAIENAYSTMDDILSRSENPTTQSCYGACKLFVKQFAGENRKKGFVFTLNQDLFIERFFVNDHPILKLPGVSAYGWFGASSKDRKIAKDEATKLPTGDTLKKTIDSFWQKSAGHFAYVKLHGSYMWRSFDGSSCMVIGAEKSGSIEREPVLKWYHELFSSVLLSPNPKWLVVVGYSFRDKHINKVIADAIAQDVLKLAIISPQSPEDFQKYMLCLDGYNPPEIPEGYEIWKGLHQYFPGRVTDLYSCQSNKLSPRGELFFERLR